jgi:hypothetical protein
MRASSRLRRERKRSLGHRRLAEPLTVMDANLSGLATFRLMSHGDGSFAFYMTKWRFILQAARKLDGRIGFD